MAKNRRGKTYVVPVKMRTLNNCVDDSLIEYHLELFKINLLISMLRRTMIMVIVLTKVVMNLV